MFKLGQILSTTQLVRNFHMVLKELEACPQPVLVTQRNGNHMVLVNAEIFEELALAKMQTDGANVEPSHLRAILQTLPRAS